jgi:cyclin H
MVDYADSSQLNKWLYASPEQLQECRTRANRKARLFLTKKHATEKSVAATAVVAATLLDPAAVTATTSGENNGGGAAATAADSTAAATTTSTTSSTNKPPLLAEYFAHGYRMRKETGDFSMNDEVDDASTEIPDSLLLNEKQHAFLTPDEEAALVTFYAAKLPTLIGPRAMLSRLRRESKVTATAAMLYRRFFLSNSVMLFDPKAVMVAAAFLASKVEDVMVNDVRYLEDGTQAMAAPVSQLDILPAELALLQACHFDLVCFHPYKAVVALTEDLRTFLKSEKGKSCVTWINTNTIHTEPAAVVAVTAAARPIAGNDLKPLYEAAREILDDYVGSDLPLLYSPAQVGLATLMVAQDELLLLQQQKEKTTATATYHQFRIDWMQYLEHRFANETATNTCPPKQEFWTTLCNRLRALKQGAYGCGRYDTEQTSLAVLKGIHKKLKKVRYWGSNDSNSGSSGSGSKKDSKKKKDKKSSSYENDHDNDVAAAEDGGGDDGEEPAKKRVKTE